MSGFSISKRFKKFKRFLETWKPIPLCWWFEERGLPIPKYFIGGAATAPSVTTNAATDITKVFARLNGNVTSDGGNSITARGFIISFSNTVPTIGGSNVEQIAYPVGVGTFQWGLSDLTSGTTYYYRAYAQNNKGLSYGSVVSFDTFSLPVTVLNFPSNLSIDEPLIAELEFTGTDSQAVDLDYNVQISDSFIGNTLYLGSSDLLKRNREEDEEPIDEFIATAQGLVREICVDDTHIYYAAGGIVYKRLKSDLSYVAQSPNYGDNILDMCIDDTHVYVGGWTTNRVRKYLKSTMAFVAETAQLGVTSNFVIRAVSVDATHIYVGENSRVRKYLKSTMAFVSETVQQADLADVIIDDLHVYTANNGSDMVKYLKTTMASVGTLNMPANKLCQDDTFIYAAPASTARGVAKVLKSRFSLEGESIASNISSAIDVGEHIFWSAGNLLYKIDKVTMSRVLVLSGTTHYSVYIDERTYNIEPAIIVGGYGVSSEFRELRRYRKNSLKYLDSSAFAPSVLWDILIEEDFIYTVGGGIGGSNLIHKYSRKDLRYLYKSDVFTTSSVLIMVSDDTHIFVAGNSRRVGKYLKDTLLFEGQAPQDTASSFATRALAVDDSYVFQGGYNSVTTEPIFYVIDKFTLSVFSTVILPTAASIVASLLVDGIYIYAGSVNIRRYVRSTLSFVDETTNYGGTVTCMQVDSTHLYVGGGTNNKVKRYLISDLSFVDETTSYGGTINTIALDDTYLYVGGDITNRVRKYLKSTMAFVSETDSYGGYIQSIKLDNLGVSTPIIQASSNRGSAGFTNTITPADIRPFTSGQKIKYTVQAAEELEPSTEYYWRARSSPSANYNTYGAWSTQRSFTTIAIASSSPISGDISTNSTLTGTLSAIVPLSANISTSSSVTANIKGSISAASSITTSSVLTANIVAYKVGSVAITTNTTTSGTIKAKAEIASNLNTSTVVSGHLAAIISIEASSNTSTSLSANISGIGSIEGAITTSTLLDGNIRGAKMGSVAISTFTTTSSNIKGYALLIASSSTSSTITGFVSATVSLSANITTSSQISGLAKGVKFGNVAIASSSVLSAAIKGYIDILGEVNTSTSLEANISARVAIFGNISTATTVSGNTSATSVIFGDITSSTTTVGLIKAYADLSGVINTLTQISGNVKGQTQLYGTVNTTTTVSALIGSNVPIFGNIFTSTTTQGAVKGIAYIVSNISTSTQILGNIVGAKQGIGAIVTQTTVSGNVLGKASLSVSINTSTTTVGYLLAPIIGMVGNITTTSQISGSINGAGVLLASTTGVSSISGQLKAVALIAGVSNTVSSLTANIFGSTALYAEVNTNTTTIGDIQGDASLYVNIQGISNIEGNIRGIANALGAINSQTTVSGTISVPVSTISGSVFTSTEISGFLFYPGMEDLYGNVLSNTNLEGSIFGKSSLLISINSNTLVSGTLRQSLQIYGTVNSSSSLFSYAKVSDIYTRAIMFSGLEFKSGKLLIFNGGNWTPAKYKIYRTKDWRKL